MNLVAIVQKIAIWAIPLILAIVVHEVAHGWVANRLGDPTAKMLGRLTLNPIPHIDPIGTILLPILMLSLSNFVFGWAKPVPIGWQNLRHPKRDMAIVALAGPFVNLLMAIAWAFILKFAYMLNGESRQGIQALLYMAQAGILINILLMVLNMLPIPPLDGSRVVSSLLPNKLSYSYSKIEPYGFFILIALLLSGYLSKIMSPLILSTLAFIRQIVGV